MEDGSNLIKLINFSKTSVKLHKSTKVRSYLKNKQNIIKNETFTGQN